MHKTAYFYISAGCVLGALGACSGDPAPDGSPNDGHLLHASDDAASTSSTVAGNSSSTSATGTATATSSTGASPDGLASSGALDGSSITATSAVAMTGVGGSMTSGTGTSGLAAGGTGTEDIGGQGGTTATSTGGAGGMGGSGATGAGAVGTSSTGGANTTGAFPEGCEVSTPVSFTHDIQPFLTTSCGKGVNSGCHVTDADSTMGSLCPDGSNNCGFTHAYDWITAGAHSSSCPETPTPKRFEVVLDVIDRANPPSCSDSRVMPPPGMGTPLTECQIAALKAWLAEPKVVQAHRADDSSPAEPYEMPPFN